MPKKRLEDRQSAREPAGSNMVGARLHGKIAHERSALEVLWLLEDAGWNARDVLSNALVVLGMALQTDWAPPPAAHDFPDVPDKTLKDWRPQRADNEFTMTREMSVAAKSLMEGVSDLRKVLEKMKNAPVTYAPEESAHRSPSRRFALDDNEVSALDTMLDNIDGNFSSMFGTSEITLADDDESGDW
ncbi:MAG: hypothetical protein HC838_11300 [Spirulinaceae cyanobacterium RM2_2_10]|nr:hypothetical protein [Spirulinaceae cyanobacterium RM2_2_10]